MAMAQARIDVQGTQSRPPEIAARASGEARRTSTRSFTTGALRGARLIGGLWLFAAGIALTVRADLGLSSWDVLHDAIRVNTPLTLGMAVIAVSVAVLVGSFFIGVRPGLGTIANVVLVGAFVDVLLGTGLLEGLASGNLIARSATLLAGVGVIAVATALYISAGLGAGPRDGLMVGLAKRLRMSAGTARTLIEGAVVVGGALMGGRLGIGTAVFALAIGPAIDISFRLFGMQPARSKDRRRTIWSSDRVVRRSATTAGNR